ncbi:protoporphyrinogen oxidase [Fodinicola acaciae]|uniref:protoporphyrinogen oxidase n=1 Tax=Fodinicola acaciae TaxID=2681555 RepID=UPI001C9E792E|nr:protoporphyrinogen oxidase [Fodinicola acaciae]
MNPAQVVVIGGGISGVSAALAVRRQAPPGTAITIVEQTDRLGGKIRTGEVAGHRVESGAETFIVRAPEAAGLAAELKLPLIHPAPGGASVWIGGTLRSLPGGTMMGVPGDPATVAGVLPAEAAAAVEAEPANPSDEPLLAAGDDVSVGALVRSRLPGEVVDRLVDPLLGGVYAGRADGLSVRVTVPALAAAAEKSHSLVAAAKLAAGSGGTRTTGPVFGTVDGGLSELVESAARESGAKVRYGLPVRELRRTATGWQLVIGSTRHPELLDADAVVLAVPAAPAARLLSGVSGAAAEIATVDYASMALVTLALPRLELPAGSGFLVSTDAGLVIKAATFMSQKWGFPDAGELAIVRASVGRFGDTEVLRRDDADLVALVRHDLETVIGRSLPQSIDTRVTRWGGGLPQYAPGHLALVSRVRATIEDFDTLAVAGAAYDGVGIPACVRSGTAAGARVSLALGKEQESDHG